MPFKSKKQEQYLRINEPEVYRDWKDKYGSYKEAETFEAEDDGLICVVCGEHFFGDECPYIGEHTQEEIDNAYNTVGSLYYAETFNAEKRDGRDMTLDEIEETYGEGRLCDHCFEGTFERGTHDDGSTYYRCWKCKQFEAESFNGESFSAESPFYFTGNQRNDFDIVQRFKKHDKVMANITLGNALQAHYWRGQEADYHRDSKRRVWYATIYPHGRRKVKKVGFDTKKDALEWVFWVLNLDMENRIDDVSNPTPLPNPHRHLRRGPRTNESDSEFWRQKGWNADSFNAEMSCNDQLNEAYEWIAFHNGEENLRRFMDSIGITDAETFDAEEWWEEYRDELESVDPRTLDMFEQREFKRFQEMKLPKAKAMQMLINSVEGDYSQLSPRLAKVAQKQEESGDWRGESFGAEMEMADVDCVNVVSKKAAFSGSGKNFYRVSFRDKNRYDRFAVPAWARKAAETMGVKYYDVSGCMITMGQLPSGKWEIQAVLIPNTENMTKEKALKMGNHMQDRIEREGEWAKKKCRENEVVEIYEAESFGADKKNCGCGKDPCVTYGVEGFESQAETRATLISIGGVLATVGVGIALFQTVFKQKLDDAMGKSD